MGGQFTTGLLLKVFELVSNWVELVLNCLESVFNWFGNGLNWFDLV